ncbi:MAG: hypothetical protein M9894_06420 [Planctomycetes bacterium]|nr:hypothetical protein [Planctomycetota bacterium]
MSIVVTCSCTRTYRLPDRYAGKRCRCRDCGKKIQVPTEAGAQSSTDGRRTRRKNGRVKDDRATTGTDEARRSKPKRNGDDAGRTTRRLSSQDQEILGERRRLRSSRRARPVSESMHQLAPLTLSGDLPVAPPPRPKAAPARAKASAAPAAPAKGDPKPAKGTKKSKKDAPAPEPRAPKKKKAASKEGADKRSTARRATPARPAADRPRTKARAKAEPARAAKRPAAGRGRPGLRGSREDDAAPRPAPSRRLPAVVAIAGALCLGIGLVIGGLIAANGGVADLEQRLTQVQTLQSSREWAAALAEAERLEADLKAAGDTKGLARLRAASAAAVKMAALVAIDDEETRLLNLVTYAADKNPTVRLGIAHELRGLAELDDAQRALAALAKDADPQVAAAAKAALAAAGFEEE